jgi:hypothetical protein
MSKDVRETPKSEGLVFADEGCAKKRDDLMATIEALRGDLRGFVMDAGYRIFLDLLEEER